MLRKKVSELVARENSPVDVCKSESYMKLKEAYGKNLYYLFSVNVRYHLKHNIIFT